jgi:hypothetical protein
MIKSRGTAVPLDRYLPESYDPTDPSAVLTGDMYDITTGINGGCTKLYLCEARKGYDGPTGWGTPDGTGVFTP